MPGKKSPAVPKQQMCYITLSQYPDGSGDYPDAANGPLPIPKVPYRVYTDFLFADEVPVPGAPASGPESDQDGVVAIPWAPKPDPSTPDDLFMVLKMFDEAYRITLLKELTPLDPAAPPDIAVLQTDRKKAPLQSDTVKAVQERLDILGYLRCYGDNDGTPTQKSFIDGINDEVTEEAILSFQHDASLRVTGLQDSSTLGALRDILAKKGYG